MEVAPVAGVWLHRGVLFWISQMLLSHTFFSTQLLWELCLVAFVPNICTVGVVIETVVLFIVGQGVSEDKTYFKVVMFSLYPNYANIIHL